MCTGWNQPPELFVISQIWTSPDAGFATVSRYWEAMTSSQVSSLVVPPPDEPDPELPDPEPPDPELPLPELLVVLVELLWIFHSPFERTTAILVVPWMSVSLRSQ